MKAMQIPTDFFETIYEYCDGRLELRAFAEGLPNRRRFCAVGEFDHVEDFCNRNKNYNLFFGVGSRDDSGSGGKTNVVEIPALWADVDFKDIKPVEVKRNLEHFPHKPSIAVLTGHGVHFYWLLKEPATTEEFPTVEDILKRICAALTADPSACEVARVLRIPGTVNVKDKPVDAKVHWLDDTRFDLSDFDLLPEVKTEKQENESKSSNTPGWMIEAFKGVPEGGNEHFPGRNVAATKIAGYFVNKLVHKDIYCLLECQNTRNTPPLTKIDLKKIVLSVSKYRIEDRPLIVQQMLEENEKNRSSQWQEVKKALGRA